MMSIKETSLIQRMRLTLTSTLTRETNHPVMGKQRNPEGSAESSPKPTRYKGHGSLGPFSFFSCRVGWRWGLFETVFCYVCQAGLRGKESSQPLPPRVRVRAQLRLSECFPARAGCSFPDTILSLTLVSVCLVSPGASEELEASQGQHSSKQLPEGQRGEDAAATGAAGRWL